MKNIRNPANLFLYDSLGFGIFFGAFKRIFLNSTNCFQPIFCFHTVFFPGSNEFPTQVCKLSVDLNLKAIFVSIKSIFESNIKTLRVAKTIYNMKLCVLGLENSHEEIYGDKVTNTMTKVFFEPVQCQNINYKYQPHKY